MDIPRSLQGTSSTNRPLPLHKLSESAPAPPLSTSHPTHPPSSSPFRYIQHWDSDDNTNSPTATPLVDLRYSSHHPPPSTSRRPSPLNLPAHSSSRTFPVPNSPHHPPSYPSRQPSPFLRQSAPLHLPVASEPAPFDHLLTLIRPWLPLILYGVSSLSFVVAIAFYRDELFAALDELSVWLRADKHFGHAVLFSLIFLTTIPPIPLYSTLIILSGYTFGPWTGAVISYFAALAGALVVFVVSRTMLRETIARWLDSTCTIKRVVRAIEKRPTLLFLIRLAPYPYNVMNCLLAAAPALTFRTYTVCTALSLFKVIVHTGVGASIHSFRDYHAPDSKSAGGDSEDGASSVARMWTIVGVGLCIAIFVYLAIVARRAVDEELGDEETNPGEETLAFLGPNVDDDVEAGNGMVESPFRTGHLVAHMGRSPEAGGRW